MNMMRKRGQNKMDTREVVKIAALESKIIQLVPPIAICPNPPLVPMRYTKLG